MARGVVVRVLIAHTNGGGEKRLRKLEPRLLEAGVTVTRTADDLPRYHGKMTIIDDELFVLGFNFTRQDIERSRSFGIDHPRQEAASRRPRRCSRPTRPGSRTRPATTGSSSAPRPLASGSSGADRQGPQAAADLRRAHLRQADPAAAPRAGRGGVEIRVIGKLAKTDRRASPPASCSDLRLHVRAIISDGATAVRRQPEPAQAGARRAPRDRRHRQGRAHRRKMQAVFEADWDLGKPPKDADEAPAADDDDGYCGAAVAAGIRVITPESTIRPVRDIVLKVSSFSKISAARNDRSVSKPLGRQARRCDRCCRCAACRPIPPRSRRCPSAA